MILLGWVVVGVLLVSISILLLTAGANAWWHMPFVPTPDSVTRQMLLRAQCKDGDTVYDLGCGDARMLILAKRSCPGIRAIGFEIAVGVWLLALVRRFVTRSSIEIRFQNFMKQNLSDANVILLYLSPSFMAMLEKKFQAELRPGTRIVSHCFQFPHRKPQSMDIVDVRFWGQQKIYTYIW